MAHPSKELEPFLSFHWGRSVSWLKWMRNAGRLTVWTRFFAFSIGRRGSLHDGWPEHAAEDALAAAKADAERLKAPWLCDCHTLTGPDEAHDYIVALEADAERLAEALTELLTYVVELRRCTA